MPVGTSPPIARLIEADIVRKRNSHDDAPKLSFIHFSFRAFIHQFGIGSESRNSDAICHDNSDNSSDSNPEHSKDLPGECASRDLYSHSAGIQRCRLLDLN